MTKVEKLTARLTKVPPPSDITFNELCSILGSLGFEWNGDRVDRMGVSSPNSAKVTSYSAPDRTPKMLWGGARYVILWKLYEIWDIYDCEYTQIQRV